MSEVSFFVKCFVATLAIICVAEVVLQTAAVATK